MIHNKKHTITALMLVFCIFTLPALATPTKLSSSQLEKMLAPIALFPDSLLGNMLTAAARPDEVVAADAWIAKHDDLNAEQVMKKCEKEPWDPSVKALLLVPETLAQMCDNMEWTETIGEAFVSQTEDVMTAIQVLRKRAKDAGNLKSTEEVIVKTDDHNNIIIGSSNPNVVVMPRYSPQVVYVKEKRDDTAALIAWSCLFVADIVYHACVWDWCGCRYWCGPYYGNCYYINNTFCAWGPRCYVPPVLCHPVPPPCHPPCHSPGYPRWHNDHGHTVVLTPTSQITPRGSAQGHHPNGHHSGHPGPNSSSPTSQITPRGYAQGHRPDGHQSVHPGPNSSSPTSQITPRGSAQANGTAKRNRLVAGRPGTSATSHVTPRGSAQRRSASGRSNIDTRRGTSIGRGSSQTPRSSSRLHAATGSAQSHQYSPLSMIANSARTSNSRLGAQPRTSSSRPSGVSSARNNSGNNLSFGEGRSRIGEGQGSISNGRSRIGGSQSTISNSRSSVGSSRNSVGSSRNSVGSSRNSVGSSRSSFGGSRSSFGGSRSSFGGGRSSFGGGRSSFGGGRSSFGGSRSSFGGSHSSSGRGRHR